MVHGIVLASELPLPGLATPPSEAPTDVTIRLGAVPEGLRPEPHGNALLEVDGASLLLRIPGTARYLVSAGRDIRIDMEHGADIDRVRLFLLGSVMGGLLYQRGLFPLHGSALETRGGAVLFLGPSGAGKSTLADHFRRRGYRILSDDICTLALEAGGRPRVLPAQPQLRLCPDALARHGPSGPGGRLDVDKFVLALGGEFCPVPVPLLRACFLDSHPHPRPLLEPIAGFQRVQAFLENLYRPAYMKALPEKARIMRAAASLAEDSEMVRLRRRRDPEAIEDTVDYLEDAWNLQPAPPEDPPP